ncbi:sensor of ECF-type sigma factor [Flavobacterium macacae]|uniref:Sensor of ECF-type sigma factor n=2 Tax=Flavobacterium macacae TaxID=2488993 RepID=A0A3P3WD21_9FLAO|nr:sensor of ECF-type sigma factor [Flavobacterium macacae]
MVSLGVAAQGKDSKRERIKALKTAFITTELDLSSEEAAKFWPVYNDFDDKQFEIRHRKMRGLSKKIEAVDSMSEKDALSVLNQMEALDDELLQNKKKLFSNLKPILSAKKIVKLKKAEDEFQRKLLKQFKEKGPKK